jgi:hypothetical protein
LAVEHTYELAGGTVAYEVLGDGPAVALVHRTPSRSYLLESSLVATTVIQGAIATASPVGSVP